MAGVVVLGPGHPLDLRHPVLFDALLELRQERLERFESEEDRLVQRFVKRCAGERAGFLVPLSDVELFVEGDQRRGHGVDDAVEIILKAGEFFLDLAAYLDFQLQLAVGVTGFFGQTLGLVVGVLKFVAGALELLLAGFDARKHGVEGVGQAADFVVIAAFGAQGVVLFAGDLARQFFELVDRLGDQALDLPGDDHPQQDTEHQDAQAGSQGAGVEGHRQFAAGHQQQVAGRAARTGQAHQLRAAKFGQAPIVDVAVALGQRQGFTMLQLRQHLAVAAVQGGGAQWGVAVEFLEQGFGGFRRIAGLLRQLRIGHQSADSLQGLRGHALLGDPVGSADKGQVGHQQDGDQQHQQGGQQLLADRQVLQAFAQGHVKGVIPVCR
ncbi:hypothetical protein D3C80_828480 [compost metagenome]